MSNFEKNFGVLLKDILPGDENYVRGAGNYYHKVYYEDIEEKEDELDEKLQEYLRKKKLKKLESFEELKKRTSWLRQFDYVAYNIII